MLSAGVDRHEVRRDHVALGCLVIGGGAPLVEQLAAQAQQRNAARLVGSDRVADERAVVGRPPQMRDDDLAPAGEGQAGRPLDVGPTPPGSCRRCGRSGSCRSPGRRRAAGRRSRQMPCGIRELAGPGADLSPAVQQRPRRAEMMDAAVPVAIGDEDVAAGPDGDIRAAVRQPARPDDRLDVVDAHRQVGPVPGVRRGAGTPRVSSSSPSGVNFLTEWSPLSTQYTAPSGPILMLCALVKIPAPHARTNFPAEVYTST